MNDWSRVGIISKTTAGWPRSCYHGVGGWCMWYLCHSLIQARIVMDSSLITIHIYWPPSPVMTFENANSSFSPSSLVLGSPSCQVSCCPGWHSYCPLCFQSCPLLVHLPWCSWGATRPTSLLSHLNTFLPPHHLPDMIQTPRTLISAFYIEFLTPQIDWIPHFQINGRHNHPKS